MDKPHICLFLHLLLFFSQYILLSIVCLIAYGANNLAFMLGTVYAIMVLTGLMNDTSVAKFTFTWIPMFMNRKYLLTDCSTQLKTTEKKTIYACHPHGILPCSTFFFMDNKIPVVVDKLMLNTFIAPYLFKYIGCVDNRRQTIIDNISKHGRIAIYPGGANELCLTKGNSKDITIYLREGFIRLAIENEYKIVPTLTLLEEESFIPLFTNYIWLKHIIWIKFGLTLAPHIGGCGLMGVPRIANDRTIYVCGKIKCKKTDSVNEISELFKKMLSDKCTELGVKCRFMRTIR